MTIIVLITKGKGEDADFAKVRLFKDKAEAIEFCAEVSTGKEKYWTKAEIVADGEEVELCRPEE